MCKARSRRPLLSLPSFARASAPPPPAAPPQEDRCCPTQVPCTLCTWSRCQATPSPPHNTAGAPRPSDRAIRRVVRTEGIASFPLPRCHLAADVQESSRRKTQSAPNPAAMAPRRSARLKATPASSRDDSGDQVPTASDALERDHDARPARPRRLAKRVRDGDALDRNTRAKRRNSCFDQSSSLGDQSTGSAASREEGSAPNPRATPDSTDDRRACNLLNTMLGPRANQTTGAGYTSPSRSVSGEAASLSDDGGAGASDGSNGTRSPRADANRSRESLDSQHEEGPEDSTPAQAPGGSSGTATPTMHHLNNLYNNSSDSNDEHVGNDEGNAGNSEADAGSDVDFDIQSDMHEDNSLSLQAAFNQDIVEFGNCAAAQSEDSIFFGPSGSPIAINLESKPFLRVFKHMKRKGWTGIQRDWDTQIDQTQPKTTVSKVLLHFARKIERLYKMGSRQPDMTAQTSFFNNHTEPLKYYFGFVDECMRFIRDKRLPPDKTEPLSKDDQKRKQMAMDLADPLIPWFVRLLKVTWHLGDPRFLNDFTIQLMAMTVGWIRQLYNTLQQETESTPVPEKRRKKKKKKKKRAESSDHPDDDGEVEKRRKEEAEWHEWHEWAKFQEARDQLDAMLQELEALLNKAPDMLAAEEEKQARLEAERKRMRELEARKAEQDRLEKEQRERERMFQNQNVARSLRREADDGWIDAEVDYLREQLQGATYDIPRLPSLQDTARRVGHSVEDTMEKSKKELRRMLGRMWGEVRSPKQIEAEVKNVMQLWRLRYP